MKPKLVTLSVLVAVLFAVCSPVLAHHGSVAYDNTKLVELKNAVVTKINWANPHGRFLPAVAGAREIPCQFQFSVRGSFWARR
jgi:hypothetical protein